MDKKFHHAGVGWQGSAEWGEFIPADPAYKGLVEMLILAPLGQDTYRIECLPFYLNDINYLDLVSCVNRGGALHFEKVLERSEWITFRVFANNDALREHIKSEVENLGGVYEAHTNRFYAISVPGKTLGLSIGGWLQEMENRDLLQFDTLDTVERS